MTTTPAPAGRTAHVNGLDLYYEIHGDGPPLVLLHGALGTIDACFAELLPQLAETHTVIAPELQAHGHTPDADRPLTYRHLADDVAALLTERGLDAVDVVGYSMGGGVALQLAISHPELVRRFVFAGGPAFRPDGLHPTVLDSIGQIAPDDMIGTPWHQAYVAATGDAAGWSALVNKVTAMDLGWVGWPPEQLRGVTAPAMLVVGDADLVRLDHVAEMFALLGGGAVGDPGPMPASRMAVLPGTSHVGMLDRPTELRTMVVEFLDAPDRTQM